MKDDNSGVTIIRPTEPWWNVRLHEIFEYRDLLFLFVYRDFSARYKQTILGPLWFVVQPLLTTIVFTVVFSGVARIPTDSVPPMLFYLGGMLTWSYFSQVFTATATTFTSNSHIFSKVYFPRILLPLSASISGLLAFVIQAGTFLVFYFWFWFTTGPERAFSPSPTLLLFPFILLGAALFSVGLGCWMSSLTSKYRDFSHLTNFLVQLLLYATPVIYPLAEVPERMRWLFILNPMTAVVESTRHAFFSTGTIRPLELVVCASAILLLFVSGFVLFRYTERKSVDTV